jgi:hypothetical protein
MAIDPLTVWHVHEVGHSQALNRTLTPDLSTAEVIPDVLDAARHQRAREPRGRSTRQHRHVLGTTGYRRSLRIAILTKAPQ